MQGFIPRQFIFYQLLFRYIVTFTRGKIYLFVKGKNGIQPFPASGSPTAGFSLSLKCERRQRVAALLYPTSFPPKQKDTFADVLLFWRRLRDSNPCGLAPKRFSRPPRYDRFDKPPYYITLYPSLSASPCFTVALRL